MKRQTILSAALAASLVLSLSPLPARAQGSAQKITGPEFCSITPGMSYDEVLSIVGDQPDRVSDTPPTTFGFAALKKSAVLMA